MENRPRKTEQVQAERMQETLKTKIIKVDNKKTKDILRQKIFQMRNQ